MPSPKEYAKTRQRLARAIEHSYPRELSYFIDSLSFGGSAQLKHDLHSLALKYAREHYNAYDKLLSEDEKE